MSKGDDGDTAARNRIESLYRPGITPEEVRDGYSDWSEKFDEMLLNRPYTVPFVTAEEVLRRVPLEKRSKARVLDVAAGTGLVGRKLHKEGFRHIDAVEPSEGMMRRLRESGVYTNDYLEFIGFGHSTVPEDTYDIVVISGGMGEGHVPVSGLDDLVRVTKKGGFVIIVMRLEFLESVPAYKGKLEPYMDELEKQGTWKKVERRVVHNYFYEKDGVVFAYCVT